jgi:hypothetical protein
MTPAELAQMQAMIDSAMDRSMKRFIADTIQPLRDDIDSLKLEAKTREADIRKHSGTHRDLIQSSTKISDNDMRQDAAIAQLLQDTATLKSGTDALALAVESVKTKQDTAATEHATTAADIAVIKTTVTSYFAQRPGLIHMILGGMIAMVVAAIAAITAWFQGMGKH